MKLTKQRLKEIIREEYQRSTPPGDGFGDNDDGYPPERPFPSLGDLQSDEKFAGGSPEEKFINKLTIVAASKGAKSGAQAAKLFGLAGDKEVEAYLDDLLRKTMYTDQSRASDAAYKKHVGDDQEHEMELQEGTYNRWKELIK
jgi:hypothetical protein